jgi:hypothetical protein
MHNVAGSTTARSRRLDTMLHSRRVQYSAVFSCVRTSVGTKPVMCLEGFDNGALSHGRNVGDDFTESAASRLHGMLRRTTGDLRSAIP